MTGPAADELSITVQDGTPPEWPDLVDRAEGSDFFHTELWTEAVCRHVPGLRPVWLLARLRQRLVGGLAAVSRRRAWLKQFDSHYEGTSGGPLVAPELEPDWQAAVVEALLRRYAELGFPGVRRLTFTLPSILEQRFGGRIRNLGWSGRAVSAAMLPLAGGLSHVEMHVFKKNRRNERNRALKRGCVQDVTTDPQDLTEYYSIYLAAARGWRVRPTPQALLRDLLTQGGGRAFLSLVRCENRIIGGHVCFHQGDRVTAWNGATLPEHNDKFPATLLIWTDIQEACRRGALWLDLGASGGIATLESFKKLLGAQEEIRMRYVKQAWLYRWLAQSRLRLRRGGSGS